MLFKIWDMYMYVILNITIWNAKLCMKNRVN